MNHHLLDGLRIIEGSAFVAAPLGGMTLAQLGADVIRFDPIGGGIDYRRWPVTRDNQSLFWAGLNKGKRSIAVDFGKPEGRELLTRLIALPGPDAGIFLTNFPARGWLDYDKLRQYREDLIMLNVLGRGDGGTAVDYTVNARVGFPFITGPGGAPGEYAEPTNHVLPAWDLVTGQMAATGILAAERHRTRTGDGQLIRLALADVALAVTAHLGYIAEVQINDADRPAYGNYLYGAFGKDFLTADGERVMVIGLSLRQWQGLVKATQTEAAIAELETRRGLDFRREGNRFPAREEIATLFGAWIGAHPLAEVAERFDSCGVCWGRYQTFRQLVTQDPDCSPENPLFTSLHQPGIGEYLVPKSPLQFSVSNLPPPMPAPRLGEHTEQILADLMHLSDGEIGRLMDRQVVAGPEPE